MHESRMPSGPGRKAFRGKVGQCNKRIRGLGTSAAQPTEQAAAGVQRGAQQTVDGRVGQNWDKDRERQQPLPRQTEQERRQLSADSRATKPG